MTELRILGTTFRIELLPKAAITTLTPAFVYKRYRTQEVRRSQGRISSPPAQLALDSWDDDAASDGADSGTYAAPGFRIVTHAVRFEVDSPNGLWQPGPILSFVWSLKKVLPIWLTCADTDFQVTWTVHPDHLEVFVADAVSGGNGTAVNLWAALIRAPEDLERLIREDVLECSCRSRCERCLLLPLTPESYVRRGLISHDHLSAFLGVAAHAR